MKYKELTTKSEGEVKKMLADLEDELHQLSVKIKLNQEKATHKLGIMKKDIARIKTYLHSKSL